MMEFFFFDQADQSLLDRHENDQRYEVDKTNYNSGSSSTAGAVFETRPTMAVSVGKVVDGSRCEVSTLRWALGECSVTADSAHRNLGCGTMFPLWPSFFELRMSTHMQTSGGRGSRRSRKTRTIWRRSAWPDTLPLI